MEGTRLEIAGQHGRPCHRLQQSPMTAECEHQRDGDHGFAEPQEHARIVVHRRNKVKVVG